MDISNKKKWKESLPEKTRIENIRSIVKTLEKAREIRFRRSNPSEWPSEDLLRIAVDYESEAFFDAANQQEYTEEITSGQMRLELMYGLVTPASEFAQTSNSQMTLDRVELPGHQRNQENQVNEENHDSDAESIQTVSDYLNRETINSSAEVQVSEESITKASDFEPGEDHLRKKSASVRALERLVAHIAVPDTGDQIVPAIQLAAGASDVQV